MKAVTKLECTVNRVQSNSLLDAALKQQVTVPYGCKNGGCGLCKVKVEKGKYKLGLCSKSVLPDEEKEAGYVLACRTFPEESTTTIILS